MILYQRHGEGRPVITPARPTTDPPCRLARSTSAVSEGPGHGRRAYCDRPRAADGGCQLAEDRRRRMPDGRGPAEVQGDRWRATLMEMTAPIRERLAALEHEQWAHWT